MFNKKIGDGFMYEVFDNSNGAVTKIPRKPGKTTLKKEEKSFNIHKKYLGDFLPETKFIDKGKGDFEVNQKYINNGNPIDLMDCTSEEVTRILNLGLKMQEKHKILFDIFGIEGMVRLFNFYFPGKVVQSLTKLVLPLAGVYLKKQHNFPSKELKKLYKDRSSPFVSPNLLKDDKGDIYFIDTDNRPLNLKNPLNLLGKWITEKALKDIKEKNLG